jgi:protein-S-isoprenylcysteine O-methyltransferase Ste14
MFPIMTIVYWRLSKSEERDAIEQFGQPYKGYMQQTPAFFPNIFSKLAIN